MSILDIIGNLVIKALNAVTGIVTKLVSVVNELLVTSKKKVLQQTQSRTVSEHLTVKPQETSAKNKNTTIGKNYFSPSYLVPGVDLLQKQGWSRVEVYQDPTADRQEVVLKDEKRNTAVRMTKADFLKYLENLNEKYSR